MTQQEATDLAIKYVDINAVDNCIVSVTGDVYYNTDIEVLKLTIDVNDLIYVKGQPIEVAPEQTDVAPEKPKK